MEPMATGRHAAFPVADVHPNDHHQGHTDRDLTVLESWLRETVGEPSPDIGRSGAVCPFTNPALKAGAMDLTLRYDVDGDPEHIRAIMVDTLHRFTSRGRGVDHPSRATRLECEIVAFPALAAEHWSLIDKVHPELKDLSVDLGLMLGQFHPRCDEGAVRNPLFPVARSPFPLFAVRFMAPHDILFLNKRRQWFERYRKRFPAEASGAFRDGLVRELAERARDRFGVPDPSVRGTEGERP